MWGTGGPIAHGTGTEGDKVSVGDIPETDDSYQPNQRREPEGGTSEAEDGQGGRGRRRDQGDVRREPR